MPDRQCHQMVDVVGHERRDRPRERRAPVVADDVSPRCAGVVEHRHHVAGERLHRVSVDLGRLVRGAIPAEVGDDHLEAGLGQRRHLVAPQPPRVGEAVEQHHRATVARHLVFDPNATDVDAHTAPLIRLCGPAGRYTNAGADQPILIVMLSWPIVSPAWTT